MKCRVVQNSISSGDRLLPVFQLPSLSGVVMHATLLVCACVSFIHRASCSFFCEPFSVHLYQPHALWGWGASKLKQQSRRLAALAISPRLQMLCRCFQARKRTAPTAESVPKPLLSLIICPWHISSPKNVAPDTALHVESHMED